ncbi:Gene Transfer Agent host specificity protein [Hyphomicrobium sulfonivorans]|uniref:Gene Transfer Agent host specificity protein n=1 Tax=Hyphomicrobium sulfonivorans TaxID=121290 RepID=A0A109BJ26_HYPSL|nr:glycoside hydrolase TIM-barrel-like domain-containing protein [Hyphomicrobium sulfonivorans]KWT68942.1 Gene Transfer Agent host specificity protein [Hyphomicrobium sulfonivorans]
MATLALAAAGAAVGGAVLPGGLTLLGATITGATLGSQLGAVAGSVIDQALLGGSGSTRHVEGPRLSELHITASTEGAPVPRVYGRVRLGGQVIWASPFEEEIVSSSSGGGSGKGLGGASAPTTVTTQYRYYANFAVALCEGEIAGVGRVWADGVELDRAQVMHRVYTGSETQDADSLIAAYEGAATAPAYRGVAYVVFERLALAPFGNRMPQLSFEVYRTVDGFSDSIRAVVMIPGSGEFAYSPTPVTQLVGLSTQQPENVHSRQGGTDWTVSLDQLEETLPNAKHVSLVVSWFGTDLRAGECQLVPGVENREKITGPYEWTVAGRTRANAYMVSQRDGRAAYGGTPSDRSVIDAIRDLNSRGIGVTLNPFILMDVPAGNALANPYGGGSQPAYPWRGRITAHPAAGSIGSVDQTGAAGAQIASFVGTAQVGHFAIVGDAVVYSGPNEWSFRRMILHHAVLAKAAGGVDAFVLCSELRGLSWVRDGAQSYPFVDALMTLAADVKTVLPDAKIVYAADWSEYFGHQPADGTGDVFFHLDPLWASDAIDAIGIDVYWPLADWRDGREHLDLMAGVRSIYDHAYLSGNLRAGEGFDWYYASTEDRAAQVRTPISDGLGKPWVYRYKDIRSWWLNRHYNRPGGVEAELATDWVPQSKPFWLMEIGCPAIDKGANQPNVFVDPKSSETALPHFSLGARDDYMQRCFLRAMIEGLDPDAGGYLDGANPVSEIYGGRMVDLARVYVYTWDARPHPAFPNDIDAWGDGENWGVGHWLTGRFASAPLADTVARLLEDYGFDAHDARGLTGTVPGYLIDRVMAARDALQPLELAYFFDTLETGGEIVFRHRGATAPAIDLELDDLVEAKPDSALLALTRGQETELPASAKLRYIAAASDYSQAVAEARRLTGASGRVSQADLPIVLESQQADAIAETWLFEAWAARERASFSLPPSMLALEPSDVVRIGDGVDARAFRVTEIGERGVREVEARSVDPELYGALSGQERPTRPGVPVVAGSPLVAFIDLPLLRGDEPPAAGYVAARQTPWPGGVAIYTSPETTGYALKTLASAPATMGVTLDPLPVGPEGRLDHAASVRVQVEGEPLTSVTALQLLAGRNLAAIRNGAGEWEVLQFMTATLVEPGVYQLGGLLRGQGGTEFAMRSEVESGAQFVLLNSSVARIDLSASEIRAPYSWRYGPSIRDIGDETYRTTTYSFAGLGLKPLSPVHVRARRDDGDVYLSWIRRTRIGGDNWEAPEVPLSEDSERYEVDVLDGGVVVRTLTSDVPTAIYTAEQQVADFGGAQEAYQVRVYQLSASYGRGTGRAALV